MVNDLDPHTRVMLLSTNPALFANVGIWGECTFSYFMKPKSHTPVDAETFRSILRIWQLSEEQRQRYVAELEELKRWFIDKAQKARPTSNILIQIFIPAHLIDRVSYLSWQTGIPRQDKLVQWMQRLKK